MSASFTLTLDTHAPRITWGATTGTTAGELFRIGYQLNEPGIRSATLRLADGRTLALTDTGTMLEVLLPVDTPQGTATVSVTVRDEVWNQATRTTTVELAGTIVPPPPEPPPLPPPGFPARPRRRQARTITSRSRVRVRSRDAAHVGTAYRATGILTYRASVAATSSAAASHTVAGRSSSRVALAPAAAVGSTSSSAVVRRGDDPQLEAMIALGLL